MSFTDDYQVHKESSVGIITIESAVFDLGELASPDLDLDEFVGELGEGVVLELVHVGHGEPDLGGVGLGRVLQVSSKVRRLDADPDRVVARLGQGLGVVLGPGGVLAVAEALGAEDQRRSDEEDGFQPGHSRSITEPAALPKLGFISKGGMGPIPARTLVVSIPPSLGQFELV